MGWDSSRGCAEHSVSSVSVQHDGNSTRGEHLLLCADLFLIHCSLARFALEVAGQNSERQNALHVYFLPGQVAAINHSLHPPLLIDFRPAGTNDGVGHKIARLAARRYASDAGRVEPARKRYAGRASGSERSLHAGMKQPPKLLLVFSVIAAAKRRNISQIP